MAPKSKTIVPRTTVYLLYMTSKTCLPSLSGTPNYADSETLIGIFGNLDQMHKFLFPYGANPYTCDSSGRMEGRVADHDSLYRIHFHLIQRVVVNSDESFDEVYGLNSLGKFTWPFDATLPGLSLEYLCPKPKTRTTKTSAKKNVKPSKPLARNKK